MVSKSEDVKTAENREEMRVKVAVLDEKLVNLTGKVDETNIITKGIEKKIDTFFDTIATKANLTDLRDLQKEVRKLQDWQLKESTVYRIINWGLPIAAFIYSYLRR